MTRKNPELRQELMLAAQQLFYTKGYENSSVNDIIKAVAVSKGAFYHHFDSKTAVLEAIVTHMANEVQSSLQEIIVDDSLTAIRKWQKMVQLANDWKIERKSEMIEANRLLMMEENLLLRHKIRSETIKVNVKEMSKIIAQGVDEGVFAVEHIPETAEIMIKVTDSLKDTVNELLANLDQYDDPTATALQKNAAVQTAGERLLGAPTGSMPIIDNETLIAWFVD